MAKFEAGKSGNPGGRCKQDPDIRDLARSKTRQAFKVLFDIMKDTDAPWSSRVSAAVAVIERGHGKPFAPIAVAAEVHHVAEEISTFERGRRVAFLLSQSVRAQNELVAKSDNVVALQPKQDESDAA